MLLVEPLETGDDITHSNKASPPNVDIAVPAEMGVIPSTTVQEPANAAVTESGTDNSVDGQETEVIPSTTVLNKVPSPTSATVTIGRGSFNTVDEQLRDIILADEDVPEWTLKVRVPINLPSSELPTALDNFGQFMVAQMREQPVPSADSVMTAILVYKEILLHPSTNASQHLGALWNLSALYQNYFHCSRQARNLEKSVQFLWEYTSISGAGKEDKILHIRNLAVSMVRPGCFETHAPEYLDQAIILYSEVLTFLKERFYTVLESASSKDLSSLSPTETVGAMADSATDPAYTLDELAYCHKQQFSIYRKVEDIDACIQLIHEHMGICNRCKTQNVECRHVWGNLADAYTHCFTELRIKGDLDEAIRLFQQCLNGWRDDSSVDAQGQQWHANLANVLTIRFTLLLDRGDLDEAIKIGREALSIFKPGDKHYNASRYHLGSSLMIRFNFFGLDEDLEESIDRY
ncbi:hypothetical protein BT96DRAFT_1000226 [Gymnopus androsaceus JB14]|uniref:TPR-like protein n=1 Tax=Gymnopus androsaceus JB14 TaxID=1447944 RepID=A0A6A4H608_9AGAR|nr:hypothetical protein BT96DRAFT_1000226 [Gymnopus androsaceus JB14]